MIIITIKEETMFMKTGQILPNYATVMDHFESHRGSVVLADTGHGYATWLCNPETGETFHGNYFRKEELERAKADFVHRSVHL
jgi:hypothetical protein